MGTHRAEIGILGGTGLYDTEMLEDPERVSPETPYGRPSDAITVGTFMGRRVAFLPRHGGKHTIPPHLINYRANVWALKELGVTRIVSPSAVGSLRRELEPGHFVLPSQFLDFTRSRKGTFSEEGRVIHISVAEPFCPELRASVIEAMRGLGMSDGEVGGGNNNNSGGGGNGNAATFHKDCTYVCIEGPRFSTKAESGFFRSTGADIIGMTLVPECQLAREAQICYTSISTVTDYDVWAEEHVTAKEVMRTLERNVANTKDVLADLIGRIPESRGCACAKALEEAEF